MQSNMFRAKIPEANVKGIFGFIDSWISEGAQIVTMGDWNVATGDEIMKGNKKFVSNCGKIFNEKV